LPKAAFFASACRHAVPPHSGGMAFDVRLLDTPAPPTAPFDPSVAYGACTAPPPERAPDNSLDMGTGYDCLDVMSYTRSPAVTRDERERRAALVAAMARRGLVNSFRELWHSKSGGAAPTGNYDTPIRAR